MTFFKNEGLTSLTPEWLYCGPTPAVCKDSQKRITFSRWVDYNYIA